MKILTPIAVAVLALTLLTSSSAAAHQRTHHSRHACTRRHGRHAHRCGRAHRHRSHHRNQAQAASAGGLVFKGTFDRSFSSYPDRYGNCASVINATELKYVVTPSCDPGGDGHYRTDVATGLGDGRGNVYPANVSECTSIPVQFPSGMQGIDDSTWFGFAEAVQTGDDGSFGAGWGMGLSSYWTGDSAGSPNQFVFDVVINGTETIVWHSSENVDTNWHTLSVCDNDSTGNDGKILGLWLDGVRQTFNDGPCAGSQTCGGFPMVTGGGYPLDINDYTGGSPTPNVVIHGAPLISRAAPAPPQPTGGWQHA